jgi:DNA-binding NtrC family response regulator
MSETIDLPQGLRKIPEAAPKPTPQAVVHDLNVIYDPEKTLEQIELQYIVESLKFHGNNKAKTSAALGITVKTLYNRLHRANLFSQYEAHFQRNKRTRKLKGEA